MKYVRVETDDQEVRWINLSQISRVTMATSATTDDPLLVVFFADGQAETKFEIDGHSDLNRSAINRVTTVLDRLAVE
ncbi:MAG: hypothetical protein AAF432_02775 [Planctomycetota bacterium]